MSFDVFLERLGTDQPGTIVDIVQLAPTPNAVLSAYTFGRTVRLHEYLAPVTLGETSLTELIPLPAWKRVQLVLTLTPVVEARLTVEGHPDSLALPLQSDWEVTNRVWIGLGLATVNGSTQSWLFRYANVVVEKG